LFFLKLGEGGNGKREKADDWFFPLSFRLISFLSV
jgi:hypothetical protein